jgi:uncharacterized membrane protein
MELGYLLAFGLAAFILIGVILGYSASAAVGQLRREVHRLLNRIAGLEAQLGIPQQQQRQAVEHAAQPKAPAEEPQPAPTRNVPAPVRPMPNWLRVQTAELPSKEAVPPSPARSADSAPPAPVGEGRPGAGSIFTQRIDREWWSRLEVEVGKRWLTWAGALILVASASFFLKYAFDQGWLGAAARVLFSVAGGLVLLGAGLWSLTRRMPALGQGLCGAGLAVIYAALYSAFAYYNLTSQPVAFILLAMVTIGGVALALAYDAMAIGVLATIGGYLAPVLVASGSANPHEVLFAYLLLLNLGVLAVALFKRWQLLDALALLGSSLLIAGWLHRCYSPEQYAVVVLWLTAFFALFMLVPFAFHLRTAQPTTLPRFLLALAAAMLTVSGAYFVLRDGHWPLLGIFTLALSGCYLLLAVAFKLRLPTDVRSHSGFLALSIALLTYCIPLLLGVNGAIIGWAIEAPVLLFFGYSFRSPLTRHSTPAVLAVALGVLLGKHWPLHTQAFQIFANPQFIAAACIPLAAWACAALHYFFRRGAMLADRQAASWQGMLGGLLALTLVHFEIGAFFHYSRMAAGMDLYYAGANSLLIWALGAGCFLAWSLAFNLRAARFIGWLLLMGLACGAFYLYAEVDWVTLSRWDGVSAFGNLRFFAVLLVVAVMFAYSSTHSLCSAKLPADETIAPTVMGIAAGMGLLLLLSLETGLVFKLPGPLQGLGGGYLPASWQLLVWVLGGAAFLAAGLLLRHRVARWTGLLVFVGVWICALALYNTVQPNELWHCAWFHLLANLRCVALLLAAACLFGYALALCKWPGRVDDFEHRLPAAIAILTGWCLLAVLGAETSLGFALAAYPSGQDPAIIRTCVLALLWAAGAAVYLGLGVTWGRRSVRLSGLLPLALAGGYAWTSWDNYASHWRATLPPTLLVLNLHFLATLAALLLLFTYGWCLRNRRPAINAVEKLVGAVCYVLADVLLLVLLSAEAYSFYASRQVLGLARHELALVALSVVWGLYAMGVLVAGFILRHRPLRASALVLFGLTTVKLLWQDLGYLDPAYRLLSSVAVGLLLIAASFLYHRISRLLEPPAPSSAYRTGGVGQSPQEKPV